MTSRKTPAERKPGSPTHAPPPGSPARADSAGAAAHALSRLSCFETRASYVPTHRESDAVRALFASGRTAAGQDRRFRLATLNLMEDAVEEQRRREQAEARTAASEEVFRLIVENAREYAIFTMNVDRTIVSWNAGAEAVLGYREQEVIGNCADFIFTPEDRAAGVPAREATTALTEGRASDERWHVRKDGSRFWGSGVMSAMRGPDGEAIGLLKIFRDQTAEREASEALEQSKARTMHALEEAERARADAEFATHAKDQFLAVLSHELRTPLTPVMLATEMLAMRSDLPENVLDGLAMILRNVKLEAKLIDDLLDVTRIAHGRMELARAPMDVHGAILAAVDVTRSDFEGRTQRLEVELDADRDRVLGDFMRLQQVVWNLLRNASKFTPQGRGVSIRTRNDGDRLIIEVADTGIGIEPSRLPHIFEAFAQADASIARRYGGLGLGLAIAKATVAGHGGELDAYSAGPGHGSTFTVRLPLLDSGREGAP